MSKNRGNFRKYGKSNPTIGERGKEIVSNIDENNEVIRLFMNFAKQLDDKHDRYERIVKLSRDITIESKRIIFALHNTSTDIETKRQTVFDDVHKRLETLISKNFNQIAIELKDQDPFQYHKAFTSGMQEFIEALVFYQYLSKGEIENWETINKNFSYSTENNQNLVLLFSQYDYILGIADFTGELMRRCINNLGVGNTDDCFKLCSYVKNINTGFLGIISNGHKEIGRKMYTLRQSLGKMELVCYNLTIRGSEIPKHMLASVLESQQEPNDEDEGFF